MEPAAAASADGCAFLEFVNKANSYLNSPGGGDGDESPSAGPTWGWTVAQVLKSCRAYPSGFTDATLLYDLFLSWTEHLRYGTAKKEVRSEGPGLSCVPLERRLPRDMHGSVDYSKYPIRFYVSDLGDNMVGVSLFGTVTSVYKVSASGTTFNLGIKDVTGVALTKLSFTGDWSLGRVGVGHMVYISGATCTLNKTNVEVCWRDKDSGSLFVNLSLLPALLNFTCLHNLSLLSDLPRSANRTHICRVRLARIDCNSLKLSLLHNLCGYVVNEHPDGLYCPFCEVTCQNGCTHGFQLHLTIADDSEKVFAWCVGRTAAELLQISPAGYMELQEDSSNDY